MLPVWMDVLPRSPEARPTTPLGSRSRAALADGPDVPRTPDGPPPPRRSSGCGCATPSAAGCGSPRTATSSAPSSGRCAGPASPWRTRPASPRTRRSRTPAPRRPAWPARRSTSRSALTQRCDPARLRAALDAVAAARPRRRRGRRRPAEGASLADRLEASVYEIRLAGRRPEQAAAAVGALLAADEVEVERMTKNGMRRFDARGRRRSGGASTRGVPRTAGRRRRAPCAILRVVVRHTTPAVRPDDVLEALRQVADLAPPVPPQVTRLAQGPLDAASGHVADPLAPDRGPDRARPAPHRLRRRPRRAGRSTSDLRAAPSDRRGRPGAGGAPHDARQRAPTSTTTAAPTSRHGAGTGRGASTPGPRPAPRRAAGPPGRPADARRRPQPRPHDRRLPTGPAGGAEATPRPAPTGDAAAGPRRRPPPRRRAGDEPPPRPPPPARRRDGRPHASSGVTRPADRRPAPAQGRGPAPCCSRRRDAEPAKRPVAPRKKVAAAPAGARDRRRRPERPSGAGSDSDSERRPRRREPTTR